MNLSIICSIRAQNPVQQVQLPAIPAEYLSPNNFASTTRQVVDFKLLVTPEMQLSPWSRDFGSLRAGEGLTHELRSPRTIRESRGLKRWLRYSTELQRRFRRFTLAQNTALTPKTVVVAIGQQHCICVYSTRRTFV